jgi:hypothetical protein
MNDPRGVGGVLGGEREGGRERGGRGGEGGRAGGREGFRVWREPLSKVEDVRVWLPVHYPPTRKDLHV